MKESYLSVLIKVQVRNQSTTIPEDWVFNGIPDVKGEDFGKVYGDSFISGFIEGGVLNAIVMKKLVSEDEYNKIGGGIKVAISVSVADVKGEAEGDMTNHKGKNNEETTIK